MSNASTAAGLVLLHLACCAPVHTQTHDTVLRRDPVETSQAPAPDRTQFLVRGEAAGEAIRVQVTELRRCQVTTRTSARIRRATIRTAAPYPALEIAGGLLWGAAAAYAVAHSGCMDSRGCQGLALPWNVAFGTGIYGSPALVTAGIVDSVRAMDSSQELESTTTAHMLVGCGELPAASRTVSALLPGGAHVDAVLDANGEATLPIPSVPSDQKGEPVFAVINVDGVSYGRIRVR